MAEVLLEVRNVNKAFGGVVTAKQVNMKVEKGESKDSLHISFLDCTEKLTRICCVFSALILSIRYREWYRCCQILG